MQNEVTEKGALLDGDGKLLKRGYSKKMLLDYDRSMIKAGGLRIKEWDYYLIGNNSFAVALTIADNSYMGLLSASFIDLANRKETTKSAMLPFTNGKLRLPRTSAKGNVSARSGKVSISFENDGAERLLRLDYQDFNGTLPFTADIRLTDEPEESMVIATPFPGSEKAFYYNQKIVGMKAAGSVSYMGKTYVLGGDVPAFGLLDWGRGVWTYDNTWYWSAACGTVGGHTFGFNLGCGFGDNSAATENMLFFDGKAHKLEDISFDIPKKSDGKDDFLSDWYFTSSDGRFEATFTPTLDRKALTSLGIIMSDQHQVFGVFNGSAELDDGSVIEFTDFMGFAEKVRNKW